MNILLFMLLGFHSGGTFKEKAEQRQPEHAYSKIYYNLERDNYSIPLKIHKYSGCVVTFSEPVDDTWASDMVGNGTGEYYKYLEWSGGKGTRIVFSSVLFTETKQNFFVQVGGRVVEFTLSQTKDFKSADRKIDIHFTQPNGKPVTIKPKIEVKSKGKSLLAKIFGQKRHNKRGLNGKMAFNTKSATPFLTFTANEGAPEIEKIEIVRGKRHWTGRMTYEYPIPLTAKEMVDGTHVMTWNRYELDRGERYYLRVKYKGEREAKFKKLGRWLR